MKEYSCFNGHSFNKEDVKEWSNIGSGATFPQCWPNGFKIPEPNDTFYIIDYFVNVYLPKITKDECDFISHILTWTDEIKLGFNFAKRIFEEKTGKLSKLKKKRLIGCLNDSDVTSTNYKGKIMHKQIKKVKKDLKKGEKDTDKLLKMDKKFDKKIAEADKKMKKK